MARNLPGHPLRVSPAGSAAVSAASSSGNRPVTLRVAGDVANRCGQDDRARVPERVLGRWGGSPRRAGALRPETEGNRVAVRRVGKQRGADHQRWSDADVVRHGRLTMQTARLHAARALAARSRRDEPPSGEPCAGDPPARLGGRGACRPPYPDPAEVSPSAGSRRPARCRTSRPLRRSPAGCRAARPGNPRAATPTSRRSRWR